MNAHLAVEEVGDPLDVLHQLAVARVARKWREHVLQEAGASGEKQREEDEWPLAERAWAACKGGDKSSCFQAATERKQ